MPTDPTVVLCACGCERPAPLATFTNRNRGIVEGQPRMYVKGHHSRRPNTPHDYVSEDRGYTTPCWTWQLATSRHTGYGLTKVKGRTRPAHRVVYELLIGPIPDGLELDHLCRNRNCVNPAHLEPVTHLENVRRSVRDSPTWGREIDRDIRAIEADLAAGMTRKAAAAKHDTSISYIAGIANGIPKPRRRRQSEI